MQPISLLPKCIPFTELHKTELSVTYVLSPTSSENLVRPVFHKIVKYNKKNGK